MGYFENEQERIEYQDQYCTFCQHSYTKTGTKQCAVMLLHHFNRQSVALETFIPRPHKVNLRCEMYIDILEDAKV